jgi:hypothetical protein
MLDLSFTHYAWWRDNVVLTLGRYSLSNHVLMDTTYVGVPSWDMMDSVVKPWIYDTIFPDLQDVTRQRGHTTCHAWLASENHFLGNHKTCTLHIDATFQSFAQGDISINDYCQKMKGFTSSLTDLGVDITDHVLMLNVLHGLNKNFEHLCTIFMHATSFPSFQKVLNDLCLEEIQQGIQELSVVASTPPPSTPHISLRHRLPLPVGRNARSNNSSTNNVLNNNSHSSSQEEEEPQRRRR